MQIVDILALLVPNIWTAITQLCATAVLFFALYKLAYKPVKKILDARSEYEQNRLAEADALKKENEEMKKQMEAELAKADDKARELVDLMVKAVTKKDASYTLESVYESAP